MSIVKKILAGLVAATAMASASATPIEVTGTFDAPGAFVTVSTNNPYDFTMDVRSSFNPLTDTLDSGTIKFFLADPQGGQEQVEVVFGFALTDTNGVQVFSITRNNAVNNGNPDRSVDVVLEPLAVGDLGFDGLINIRLSAFNGNYNFHRADFIGMGDDGEVAQGEAPEPLSLALMGIALAGAGIARRRGKQA